jgi:tetratricopeptide (TPR) repeat protein
MPKTVPRAIALGTLVVVFCSSYPVNAASGKAVFELEGKIVTSEQRIFRSAFLSVSLHGTESSFSVRTLADGKGKFKFKNLAAGMYTLIIFVPQARPVRKTIDIGPSFADSRGKISISIPFERQAPGRRGYTVSTSQLSIPDAARDEYRKALEYLEKRDAARASACLKKAVEIAPQFAGAWNQLGNIAYESNQVEDAEIYFRQALNQNPNFYGALVSLGGALISQGKESESLSFFLRAVKLRPDDPIGRARLGLNYLYLGKLDEAEEHLKEAKKLEPGHFSFPQLLLAEVYVRRGDRAAAICELEEFVKIHPDSDRIPDVRKSIERLRSPQHSIP